MKKIIITLVSSIFLLFGNANAVGFNLGLSGAAGVFDVDGATEKNADATINTSDESENAEGLYAIGSAFAEVTLTDKIAVGVDYVPHSLESNQVSNEKEVLAGSGKTVGTNVTNTAEVHIEDLYTVYASLFLNDNIYVKAGYSQGDVLTIENLGTGGAYPNTTIDGIVVGLGYDRDLSNGMFVRMEANYMDYGSVQVTNSNDSTKTITVDGVGGYGARLSIGKSF
jgi:hypothetical protein